MASNDPPCLKILIIGESFVGKSCLLLRFTDETFENIFMPTVGVDYKTKIIDIDGSRVKLQIWDTAGQKKFRAITKAYYRGANGILLVFDISRRETFSQTRDWIDSIKEADQSIDIILVGNKCDLERDVTREEAEDFAKQFDIRYFETSAKDNTNVEEAFMYLATQSFRHTNKKESRRTTDITKSNGEKKENGCKC